MSNIEALERLVGSSILAVELLGGEYEPYGVEITTTDGETIIIMATMYENLAVSIKEKEG